MNRLFSGMLLVLMLAVATVAWALPTDVTGVWSNPIAVDGDAPYCPNVSNGGTLVSYGADNSLSPPDWTQSCNDTQASGQSGLEFIGSTSLDIICGDVDINLGQFTHYNNPIFVDVVPDNLLSAIDLTITLSGDVNAAVDFTVDYGETPNSDDPCSYPTNSYASHPAPGTDPVYDNLNDPDGDGVYACGDRVGFANVAGSGDVTDANGDKCPLIITGFGPCGVGPQEGPVEFLTVERTDNSTCLWASTSPKATAVDMTSAETLTPQSTNIVLAMTFFSVLLIASGLLVKGQLD